MRRTNAKTDKRGTWAYHSIGGWYIRTSPEHYRTHVCVAKKTKSERCIDTIQFNNKRITNPTLTHGDKLMKAVADCINQLRKTGTQTKSQTEDLIKIMKNTKQFVTNNYDAMEQPAETNNNIPARTVQQVPRAQQVPRVVNHNIDDDRRRTRSMTQSSDKQNNNNATVQLPRVVSNTYNKLAAQALAQIQCKPQIKDGPATRTRSKLAAKEADLAPPATRTRSKKKPISSSKKKSKLQQPTKVPNHLRPTKASVQQKQPGRG